MVIKAIVIQPPRKPNLVASASVTLEFETYTLLLGDLRILKNKQGVHWIAFPDFPVQRERGLDYLPVIEPNQALRSCISDAVIAEFEKQQSAGVL